MQPAPLLGICAPSGLQPHPQNYQLWRCAVAEGVTTPADGAHPLTELILADYLVVEVVGQGSFLEIELAARRGEGHRTCGRALDDDVMDTVLTLLVNGGNGPVIRDGIDRPSMLGS